MKRCRICGDRKPLDLFYDMPHNADGLDSRCKECTKAAVRKNRRANIDYYRDWDRKRSDLPERIHLRKAVAERRKNDPELRTIDLARSLAHAQKNPIKRAARGTLANAIRDGRITPPSTCESCGADEPLHGHHEDYSKPLDIVWLCLSCHGQRHREINADRRKA